MKSSKPPSLPPYCWRTMFLSYYCLLMFNPAPPTDELLRPFNQLPPCCPPAARWSGNPVGTRRRKKSAFPCRLLCPPDLLHDKLDATTWSLHSHQNLAVEPPTWILTLSAQPTQVAWLCEYLFLFFFLFFLFLYLVNFDLNFSKGMWRIWQQVCGFSMNDHVMTA